MPFRIPTFYNLTKPVGKSKPSLPLDVLLVKFFLKEIAAQGGAAMNPPNAPLDLTGTVDQNTVNWISAYQKSKFQLYADGIVDPVPERNLTAATPVHNKVFTIFELNFDFELHQPEHFHKIWEHPRCPPALGQALKMGFQAIH
jgi:hypothetical protein